MKTILFLHGFFASGSCVPAQALQKVFDGRYRVLTPDLPVHPTDALEQIRTICDMEKVDLMVGNSVGSFFAQMIAQEKKIPALLSNPYLMMTEFLKPRIGEHEYKSSRVDGKQKITVDEALIDEYADLEQRQFEHYDPKFANRIWAIFGKQDTLAHFEPLYLQYYSDTHYFPGAHQPTEEDIRSYHAPLIEQMLDLFCNGDNLSEYEKYCMKQAEDQEVSVPR